MARTRTDARAPRLRRAIAVITSIALAAALAPLAAGPATAAGVYTVGGAVILAPGFDPAVLAGSEDEGDSEGA